MYIIFAFFFYFHWKIACSLLVALVSALYFCAVKEYNYLLFKCFTLAVYTASGWVKFDLLNIKALDIYRTVSLVNIDVHM